jgi:hypothetical protein
VKIKKIVAYFWFGLAGAPAVRPAGNGSDRKQSHLCCRRAHIRADTGRRERAQAGTAPPQSRYLPWRTGSSRYSPTSEQILAVENGLKQVQPHLRADTCRGERAQAVAASHQSRYLPLRTGSSRYSLTSEQILAAENGLKQVQPHIRADTGRRERAQAGTASHQSRYLLSRTGSSRYSLTSEQIRYLLSRTGSRKNSSPHIRADTCC